MSVLQELASERSAASNTSSIGSHRQIENQSDEGKNIQNRADAECSKNGVMRFVLELVLIVSCV